MPIYEYRCEKGHTFEVLQRMSDDTLGKCTVCAAPVQRVFHPIAVHFKGSGFYSTDYGKQKGKGSGSDGAANSDSGSSSDSKDSKSSSSDSSDKADKKPSKASAPSSDS